MNPIPLLLFTAALATLAVEPAAPGPPAAAVSVQDLGWLSGCWASVGREPGSGETWTSTDGGTLFGLSRTVKGGRTVAHEFLQIREAAPGQVVLIALPSGQSETTFPLVRVTGQEAVFENPQHDFPQRVLYRRDKDRLTGRIEGRIGGQERSADFPMTRIACPAPD